jgi:hypothetical protein
MMTTVRGLDDQWLSGVVALDAERLLGLQPELVLETSEKAVVLSPDHEVNVNVRNCYVIWLIATTVKLRVYRQEILVARLIQSQ